MLTCRDYSTDLVRTSFLSDARIGHSVISVSPLADSEVAEVAAALQCCSLATITRTRSTASGA
jgi:hypothetical protein